MSKFYIKDVDGNILFEVDTEKYPDAKPHKCRIRFPGSNIVCSYKGNYFVAKRKRDGTILDPIRWLPITHEYYDMFVYQGSDIIPPDDTIINYVDAEVQL